MHELSVMSHVLERVEEHALRINARKVVAINLVIGERQCVIDDSLLYYFDMLTPGTVAEGAVLNVRHTPTQFHCEPCGQDYRPALTDFLCPICRNVGRLTGAGSELLIESMEIES